MERRTEAEGWEVQDSVGWSINTAGIIKSLCSAFCSPSLWQNTERGLLLSYALQTGCVCVYAGVCMCVPLITKLSDSVTACLVFSDVSQTTDLMLHAHTLLMLIIAHFSLCFTLIHTGTHKPVHVHLLWSTSVSKRSMASVQNLISLIKINDKTPQQSITSYWSSISYQ